jgi:hypothetical protein
VSSCKKRSQKVTKKRSQKVTNQKIATATLYYYGKLKTNSRQLAYHHKVTIGSRHPIDCRRPLSNHFIQSYGYAGRFCCNTSNYPAWDPSFSLQFVMILVPVFHGIWSQGWLKHLKAAIQPFLDSNVQFSSNDQLMLKLLTFNNYSSCAHLVSYDATRMHFLWNH